MQVFINHPLSSEAVPRALECTIGVIAAEITVFVESTNYAGQARGIVGAEIKRSVTPNFTECWNVIGHNRTSRKCSLKRGHAKGFIPRSGGINRRLAIKQPH